jgi:membrane fusion protein (multidrug efflux system)
VIIFLCLLFTAIVVKLKLGPKGIAWLGVGFVLPVVIVVAFWHLDAPMSSRVVTTQYVVQLVPYVKGQIKKVHAKANQPMKKGDVLVEIDASPYQDSVNQLQAQLAGAKDNVKQRQAALQSSEANVVKAGADVNQGRAAVTQSKAALTNARAGLTKSWRGWPARRQVSSRPRHQMIWPRRRSRSPWACGRWTQARSAC